MNANEGIQIISGYENLNDPVAFAVFILTLILPVIIGFVAINRAKNQAEFLAGGQAMGKWTVALSAVSSGRSSWLVLALSGMAYIKGVGAVWAVVGYIIAEMLQFIFIGRPLRKEAEKYKAITLLDYFESRFNDRKQTIRIVGSIIIAVFMITYVAAQLNAGAKSLSTAMNISFGVSLVISMVMTLIYMVMGGYIAVAYNDVVRAIIMIIGLIIFPLVGVLQIGGLHNLLLKLQQIDPKLLDPWSIGFLGLIGFVGIGLGCPGQPHILVRYMSIDDPEKLRHASVIGTFWNVALAWGAVFVGLVGRAIIPSPDLIPVSLPLDKRNEMIYLVLATKFFGTAIYGLLIGGIFAAILSTIDSQLLVVCSTIQRDIYEMILRKGENIPEKERIFLSRSILIISGILAIVLAWYATDLIFWLVLFAWGGPGASIGATIICALYWKQTTTEGVVAGMITGTAVVVLWNLYLKNLTGVYELIPAFPLALLATVIVSIMTSKPESSEEKATSELFI